MPRTGNLPAGVRGSRGRRTMSRIVDNGRAAGPSWLGAAVRAFHPARWGLCGVGLAASVLLCTTAQAVFAQALPRPQAWWQDPLAELRRLGAELFERGSGTAVFRCFLLSPGRAGRK